MKYKEEYLKTNTREEFIKLLKEKYKHLSSDTPRRAFYKVRLKYGKQKIKKDDQKKEFAQLESSIQITNEKNKPNRLKMIMIDDMKRFKIKISKELLSKYGFKSEEIEWLEDNNKI